MDVMKQRWACFTCHSRFDFGDLIDVPGNFMGVGCPKCKSGDMHCIEPKVSELTEYHGEKGTVQ